MTDILIDTNGDVMTANGDLATGQSDEQHIEMLLRSMPGEWKETPECGAALPLALGGAIDRFLERNIRVQLEADGFKLSTLEISENGIKMDGQYDNDNT